MGVRVQVRVGVVVVGGWASKGPEQPALLHAHQPCHRRSPTSAGSGTAAEGQGLAGLTGGQQGYHPLTIARELPASTRRKRQKGQRQGQSAGERHGGERGPGVANKRRGEVAAVTIANPGAKSRRIAFLAFYW